MRTLSKLLDRGLTGSGDGVPPLDSPDGMNGLLNLDERGPGNS